MLRRTSAEEIRRELAARIFGGALAPGSGLDETSRASEFAVSRTPVREALRLLAASGLVEQRAHAKALVAKPEPAQLAGMFEAMGYLEALCAGLCAAMMQPAERDALDALHQEMAGYVRDGDAVRYAEANDVFHAAIYEGAPTSYLNEITRSPRQRLQPFRRAQFSGLGRLATSHAEHGAGVEASLQADRAAAELAMRQHIASVETAYQQLARR